MAEQLFYAVLTGLVLGAVYDFLRFFRIVLCDKFFFDFLFWILSALSVFCYLLIFCQGNIRTIVILFVFIGFLLYIFTLGYATLRFEKAVGKKIKIWLKKLKNKLKIFKKVLQYPYNIYYNIKVKKGVSDNKAEGEFDEEEYDKKEDFS